MRGEPKRYELRKKPHALRLACLTLREEPERSVNVQVAMSQEQTCSALVCYNGP